MATKKTTSKDVDQVEIADRETTEEKVKAKASETTAQEREADDEIETVEFTVEVRGKELTFTIPSDVDDVDGDAALDMENGKLRNAVAKILGERQMMKLRQARYRKSDIEKIAIELNEAWGLGEG